MQSLQSTLQKIALPKNQIRFLNQLCLILIVIGAASLTFSILYNSQILTFVGLGLIFWGAILLFIQPESYTKKVILDTVIATPFKTLNQIINELGYKGKAIYLPPNYFGNHETPKIYLSKYNYITSESIMTYDNENTIFLNDQDALLMTPPGAQLTELLEKRLGKNFTEVNMDYIQQNLPKIFIDDLELSENLEIEINYGESESKDSDPTYIKVHVKITNSIFQEPESQNYQSPEIFSKIGSPLASAIACALTKVTRKPVIIDENTSSDDLKVAEITYQIENTERVKQPVEQKDIKAIMDEPEKPFMEYLPIPVTLIGAILTLLGIITLLWIGQLGWYEMTVWEKTIQTVLFAPRTGENISLGIGMRAIHYVLIGIVVLISGIYSILQGIRSRNKNAVTLKYAMA